MKKIVSSNWPTERVPYQFDVAASSFQLGIKIYIMTWAKYRIVLYRSATSGVCYSKSNLQPTYFSLQIGVGDSFKRTAQ